MADTEGFKNFMRTILSFHDLAYLEGVLEGDHIHEFSIIDMEECWEAAVKYAKEKQPR